MPNYTLAKCQYFIKHNYLRHIRKTHFQYLLYHILQMRNIKIFLGRIFDLFSFLWAYIFLWINLEKCIFLTKVGGVEKKKENSLSYQFLFILLQCQKKAIIVAYNQQHTNTSILYLVLHSGIGKAYYYPIKIKENIIFVYCK